MVNTGMQFLQLANIATCTGNFKSVIRNFNTCMRIMHSSKYVRMCFLTTNLKFPVNFFRFTYAHIVFLCL